MGKFNITQKGMRNFADLLSDAMQAHEPRLRNEDLVRLLGDRGYDTSMSTIARLRQGGKQLEPGVMLFWHLVQLQLIRQPTGNREPYSFEELLLILSGQLDPFAGLGLAEVAGDYQVIPNATAVQFLRELIAQQQQTVSEFARSCGLREERLRQILAGATPEPPEFVLLSQYLKDKNPAPLIALYYPEARSAAARKPAKQPRTD